MDYLTYCLRLLSNLPSSEIKKFMRMEPKDETLKDEKKGAGGEDDSMASGLAALGLMVRLVIQLVAPHFTHDKGALGVLHIIHHACLQWRNGSGCVLLHMAQS